MLPLFATASDLQHWADRRDAQGDLPKLIRRLISATAQDITKLEIRSGEGIGYDGFDGIVEVGKGNSYVPDTFSVWEMGVDKNPKGKAESDYNKRVKDSLGIDPSQAAFVFVTPRRWKGKEKWTAEKQQTQVWREVRVIDADDLEGWLEQALPVHAWISNLIGKDVSDIEDLETSSRDWREATLPPFSSQLIIAGRDENIQSIVQYLQAQPTVIVVRADSQSEAIAFIAAAIEQLPVLMQATLFARTLIVHSAQAWRQIVLTEQPLILLPTFQRVDTMQATRYGHHVLIPVGKEIAETRDMITLARPSRQAIEEALKAMGIDQERIPAFARLVRRNLLTLHRKLSRYPVIQQPAWASSEKTRILLAALLAGGWNGKVEGDKQVISTLTGRPYQEVDAELMRFAHESDPPIRQNGSNWLLVSKDDAWRFLAQYLTQEDLHRLHNVTLEVFGALDPALELPLDEQWMANVKGKSRPHSELLRQGLADTLALIAARSGEEFLGGTESGQDFASALVYQLLQQANHNQSGEMWISLSDILPLLVEAAPNEFLSALDKAMAGSDPLILKLFTDRGGDFFTYRSAHPMLLNALERLAWSPTYLGRAALSLARLAHLDPGGRLGNRPSNSLRAIFCVWCPQTSATSAQRLRTLDMLRTHAPEQAWKLMISLLPRLHDTSDVTDAPQWQEWKIEESQHAVTIAEYQSTIEALVARLLQDVGQDAARICDLITSTATLPPVLHASVFAYLETLDPAPFEDKSRNAIWAVLRDLISNHRRHAHVDWAMPPEEVDRLAALYQRFTPIDPIQQTSWLFSGAPHLPETSANATHEEYERAVETAQISAIQLVFQERGHEGLLILIEVVENPKVLGWVLGKSDVIEAEEHILKELGLSHEKRQQAARAYVMGRFRIHGWEWADNPLDRNRSFFTAEQRAAFFLGLPSTAETWDRLEQGDQGTIVLYWTHCSPFVDNPADCLRAVEQLLVYQQGWNALTLLAFHFNTTKPSAELVMRILETAMNSPVSNTLASIQYEVSTLFTYLDQFKDVDEDRLARIEWAFLPFFRFDDRSFKILHHWLATTPSFFVEIVSAVFKASDEEPHEASKEEQMRATMAFQLLRSANIVPGSQEDGTITETMLTEWVNETRKLLVENKRLRVGDHYIGYLLSHAKPNEAGMWPPKEICTLLETIHSEDIEHGIEEAVHNNRGVTTRGVLAGGEQEWQLEQRYLAQAEAVESEWPRTAEMFRRLAQRYKSEAKRTDQDAELRQDTW